MDTMFAQKEQKKAYLHPILIRRYIRTVSIRITPASRGQRMGK